MDGILTYDDLSKMKSLDYEGLVEFLIQKEMVPLGQSELTDSMKTGVIELLRQQGVNEGLILQFQLLPTVSYLQNCLASLPDVSIMPYTPPIEHIAVIGDEGAPHPLLIQEAGNNLDFSLSTVTGVSSDLIGTGQKLLRRAEGARGKVTKLEGSELARLCNFLLTGEKLPNGDVKIIEKMINPYTSFIEELFRKSEIEKLSKVIKRNRHTKQLLPQKKALLLSVLGKIEHWYAQSAELYRKGEQINRSDSNNVLLLNTTPGINTNTLTGLVDILKRGSAARSEVFTYIAEKKEAFLLLQNSASGNNLGPQTALILDFIHACLTEGDMHTIIKLGGQLRLDEVALNTSLTGTPYIQIFASLTKLLDTSMLRRQEIDVYIASHTPEIALLEQQIRKQSLSPALKDFFTALHAEVSPEKTLFLHFKQKIYPHDVLQDISRIKDMVQHTGRINFPSGVLALTGQATSPIIAAPMVTDNQVVTEDGKVDAILYEERTLITRFDGVLKAYMETSDLLTKDALMEVRIFTQLVLSHEEVSLGQEELAYLYRILAVAYRKQSEVVSEGSKPTPAFQGLSAFVSSSDAETIPEKILQNDFVLLCLEQNGLLGRMFHNYNRGKFSLGSNELIQREQKSALMITEGVVATSFFRRVLYDVLAIYNTHLSKILEKKESKSDVIKTMKDILKKYHTALAQMHGDAIITPLDEGVLDTREHEKYFTQLLQGHTIMYAHLAGVLGEIQKLTKELGSKEAMLKDMESKYGKESIQYIIAHLSVMMGIIGVVKGNNAQEVFMHLLGADTPLVIFALLYQDVQHLDNESSKEAYIQDMLEKRHNQLNDIDAFFEQLDLFASLFPEGVLENLYKLFAIYLLERGDVLFSLEKYEIDNNFETYYKDEPDGGYNMGTYSSEEMDLDGELVFSQHDDGNDEYARVYATYYKNPQVFFRDALLPSVDGDVFGEQVFTWLFEKGQGEWLLQSILAHYDASYKPNYPDGIFSLKAKITEYLSIMLPKKQTTTAVANALRGSIQAGYGGLGLAAGNLEKATSEDVDELALLLADMPDGVLKELNEEYGEENGEENFGDRGEPVSDIDGDDTD